MNYYVSASSNFSHAGTLNERLKAEIKLRYTEPKYIKRKKIFLWWDYTRREVIDAPFHIRVPMLLYSQDNDFYEYFTGEFFGKIKKKKYEDIGIFVSHQHNHIVNTELSAYNDGYPYRESSIRECKALDFLNILENVKAAAANVGLTEQDIKEQIALQFAESRQKKQREQAEKILALENEKRKKAIQEHQEQQARKHLELSIRERI